MSQLTMHILDTTQGKPAAGVEVVLFTEENNEWIFLAKGITGNDGRITNLLEKGVKLNGICKMRFETSLYFTKNNIKSFYPYIEISFLIDSKDHYHIPLLLNPYGYTTYRGS